MRYGMNGLWAIVTPRSLRWQFRLALAILVLLIATASWISFLALRQSVALTRQLAEERLVQLEVAQELSGTAMQLELETNRLLTATTEERIQTSYAQIIPLLDLLDNLAVRLGGMDDGLSILAIHQAEQIFRNIIHVVVGLRTLEIQGTSPQGAGDSRQRFSDELSRQASELAVATGRLSAHGKENYQAAVRDLVDASEQSRRLVLTIFVVSLIAAWLFFFFVLEQRVLARLHQVSDHLLWGEVSSGHTSIPVQGSDEIGRMARSVEQFKADRYQLAATNRALQKTNDMLQGVLNAAPTAIIDLDLEGKVHSVWNTAAEKMFGWKAEEVMGRFLPTIPSDRKEEIQRFRDQTRNGLTLNGVEVCRQRRDGSPVDYSIYAAPLRDGTGAVTGNIAVMVDITMQKQLQNQVSERSVELERSNRELEQFAYAVSHDLQEPLRMVASYVKLLARRYRGRLDDDADDFIHFAADGAERMQRMINDLLAYSRITTKGRALEPVDSAGCLETALANLALVVEEAGAEVSSGTLPQVWADGNQLNQLFQNLVANALKFRKPDSQPKIHVDAVRQGEEWLFSVRDNGIGIKKQDQERIFQLFQRLHGRESYPGTGIGLTLCQRIVARHGGRIWVESEPGLGAVFYFTLSGREADDPITN